MVARVKFPLFSESATGPIITNYTSPARGSKRSAWKMPKNGRTPRYSSSGRHAGPLLFSKDGTVRKPGGTFYDSPFK